MSRQIKDFLTNALTYIASGFAMGVLIIIFIFIFTKGFKTLSFDMLKDDYWSNNFIMEVSDSSESLFVEPENLDKDNFFSTKYGVALKDATNQLKQKQVLITYLDPNSPISNGTITTKGEYFGSPVGELVGVNITRMELEIDNNRVVTGSQLNQNAKSIVDQLDDSSSINSIFYQTKGGGIRGSLLTTTYLILLTLLIALPIGIGAAIYLEEFAVESKLTNFIKQAIEMLAGVPSIIFGLMGVVVFFPITQLFGAHSLSILLGSLTLSVLLLPVIIRQTQESLLVVPQSFRQASLSLGATKTQTIFRVILPSALPGLISAVLLSISRIIGESAALIYTMGTAISDNPKLLEPATSMAVQIWSIMSGEQPNFELASALSIIILVIVLTLNLTVKFISNQLRKRWLG